MGWGVGGGQKDATISSYLLVLFITSIDTLISSKKHPYSPDRWMNGRTLTLSETRNRIPKQPSWQNGIIGIEMKVTYRGSSNRDTFGAGVAFW